MLKILLADDHQMIRDGLSAILEREGGFEIVGEAANGREAIAAARRVKPDVIVMDVSMPEMNGIDAVRLLLRDMPNVKIVGLSASADRRGVLAMFDAGAKGYLLKSSAAEELVQAVRAVARNHTYISPQVAHHVVERGVKNDPEGPLTSREREVLQLLAEGKTSKEIGDSLGVAVATVDTYRRLIMDKLNLRTIAELTKYAVREGLTTLE